MTFSLAASGLDFVMSTSTITFSAGSTVMCFNLTILDDSLVETEEVFEISLVAQASVSMPALLRVSNVAEIHVTDLTSILTLLLLL
jgi:uncharacterized protein (UPF0548 family)